jgi:hypothetical protein
MIKRVEKNNYSTESTTDGCRGNYSVLAKNRSEMFSIAPISPG